MDQIKRHLVFAVVFVLTVCVSSGADVSKLIPVKENGKWGYINATGKLVIPMSYDGAGEFDKFGFAIIKKGSKYGLIDKFNSKVIQEKYDNIEVVDRKKILVKQGDYFGVINLINNTPVEFQYDEIKTFDNGFLKIKKGNLYGIVSDDGKLVSDPLFSAIKLTNNFFICSQNKRYGVFNLKGTEILKAKYKDIIATEEVLFFQDDEGLWGGVNIKGDQLIPKVYEYLQLIAPGLVKTTSGNKHGLIAIPSGKQLFDTKLKQIYSINEKLVAVQFDRQYKLVQSNGQALTSDMYADIRPLNGSLISVTHTGSKWGVVDYTGKTFLNEEYEYIGFYDYNILKLVKHGETSTKYIPEEYLVNNLKKDLVVEQHDAKDLLSNTKNEEEDANEELAERFGWFKYKKTNTWGLRSKEGKVLIRPVFTSVYIHEELNYAEVEMRYPTSEIKKNVFKSKKTKKTRFEVMTKFGVFDHTTNSFIIPPKFWSIKVEDFKQGNYAHAMLEGGYPCLISKNGKDVKFSRIIKGRNGSKVKQLIGFIGEFVDGYAAVNYGGTLDVADEFSNDVVGGFNESLPHIRTSINQPFRYVTVKGGVWGYLDRNGAPVIRPLYAKARNMINGVFPVKGRNGMWGILSEQMDTLSPFKFANLEVFDKKMGLLEISKKNNYYAMADKQGNIISESVFEAIYDFHDGFARAKTNGKWTFIDENGKTITTPKFDAVKDFQEDLAPVKVGKLWGFIDKIGNFIIKPQYFDAGDFYDGLAWVQTRSGYGYIDKSGKEVIEPEFSAATDFTLGAAVVKSGGSFGVINKSGKYIVSPKYGKISRFDKSGYASVSKSATKGPYGLVNTAGKLVISLKYQDIRKVREGLVGVKKDGYYGFATESGKIVIKPKYKDVHEFNEGIAAVKIDNLWGYIDTKGVIIIDPIYENAHDFSEGKAIVSDKEHTIVLELDGQEHMLDHVKDVHDFHEGVAVAQASNNVFYFMNEDGQHIFQGDYEYAEDFIQGLAVVKSKGKFGLIDHNGNYVLQPYYDRIIHLKTGNAIVKTNKLVGLLGTNGLEVLDAEYDRITKFDDELIKVEKSGNIGYTNSVGNWLWEPKH